MNSRCKKLIEIKEGGAMIEILIVVAMLALLATLLWPRMAVCKAQATRIDCVNNLKQMGLASRIWSNEHDKLLSWQVSTNESGALEFAPSGDVSRLLGPLSHQLRSSKLLLCPSETRRLPAESFETLKNENISYLVGLDASEDNPQMILFGDRNLRGPGTANKGVIVVSPDSVSGWGKDLHIRAGNLGLVDGSVQQVTDTGLQKQMTVQGTAVRFAIP
jgi:hypothetical protein